MALYTDTRVENIDIKLILNSRLADSIITKQLMDQLGYQSYLHHQLEKKRKREKQKKNYNWHLQTIPPQVKELSSISACIRDDEKWPTTNGTIHYALSVARSCQMKNYRTMFLAKEKHVTKHKMISVKAESATTSKLLEIKNNPLSLPKPEYIMTFDIFGNIEDDSKYFYEHYQNLASTRKEQKQRLADLNTKLCDHCLISCYFQYYNKCDIMFNLPSKKLYPITKLPKPKVEEELITKDISF
ncbi:hypothetical protein G9A89_014016 [Geosiphon pyriformis]|nr:hypothetical protein G9A89_014016 [Geosiphon pyriformis]